MSGYLWGSSYPTHRASPPPNATWLVIEVERRNLLHVSATQAIFLRGVVRHAGTYETACAHIADYQAARGVEAVQFVKRLEKAQDGKILFLDGGIDPNFCLPCGFRYPRVAGEPVEAPSDHVNHSHRGLKGYVWGAQGSNTPRVVAPAGYPWIVVEVEDRNVIHAGPNGGTYLRGIVAHAGDHASCCQHIADHRKHHNLPPIEKFVEWAEAPSAS
jgi:hypothetical protein